MAKDKDLEIKDEEIKDEVIEESAEEVDDAEVSDENADDAEVSLDDETTVDDDDEDVDADDEEESSKEVKSKEVQNDDEDDDVDIPKSKLPMILAGLVVLAVILGCVVGIIIYKSENTGNKGLTAPVATYLKGYQDKDINEILSAYPDAIRDTILATASADAYWDSLNETFTTTFGENWTASYSVDAENIAEISDTDISAMKEDFDSQYNTTFNFETGYWVQANLTLSGNDNNVELPLIFAVVNIDGQNYVIYETTRSTSSSDAAAE